MVDRPKPVDVLGALVDGVARRLEIATRDWGGGDTSGQIDPPTGNPDSVAGLDLADCGDEFVVTVDVPGYDTDSIHVELTGDVLHLSGTREGDSDERDGEYVRRERRRHSFDRRITLPDPVDPEAATARERDGVLTVELPKLEARAESRSIDIE